MFHFNTFETLVKNKGSNGVFISTKTTFQAMEIYLNPVD